MVLITIEGEMKVESGLGSDDLSRELAVDRFLWTFGKVTFLHHNSCNLRVRFGSSNQVLDERTISFFLNIESHQHHRSKPINRYML